MYSIICNARRGKCIDILALVDRQKSRRLWWTSDDPAIILEYRNLDAAKFACKRLKRNRARIISSESAKAKLRHQAEIRAGLEEDWAIEAGHEAVEAGWDGHKNAF